MTDERPGDLFGLQETLYESSNYTRRRLHRTRYDWVCRAIARHAPGAPRGRAIEYGPGSGIYLPVLREHFEEVVAADVEMAYLDGIAGKVRPGSGITLMQDSLLDSRLEEGSFALALCTEVLEHVPDPRAAVNTLHRILAPGGIAVISTPQRYSVMEVCARVAFLPGIVQLVRLAYREPILEMGHISLMTHRTLTGLVREAGFETLEEDKFALYLPLLAEFGGRAGGRAIEAVERAVHGTPLDGLLWTQAMVLRKRGP